MITRTTQTVARFLSAFALPGMDEKQPAGSYRIDYVEEVLEGLSTRAWHRVEAFICLPSVETSKLPQQMVPIDPADLDAVLERNTRMNTAMINPRAARPVRRDPETHLFAVGQTVRLKSWSGMSGDTGSTFQITATLPSSGDSPQYRIRNDDERHERMTSQDNIELVTQASSGGGTTLLERTFGNGKGTKA